MTDKRRPASSIEELDIHLGYVQEALRSIQESVKGMATKEDIRELSIRMGTFATKDELAALAKRVEDEATGSKLKRLAGTATSIMALIALASVTWAAVVYIVHLSDAVAVAKP